MGKRRKAREYALQMLYAIDMTHSSPEQVDAWFWDDGDRPADPDTRRYATELVTETRRMLARIDALIESHSVHWKLNRMSVVDRNILRAATCELLMADVPAPAVINEAIELAKRYSDGESPHFINGVLDAIHHALPRTSPPTSRS